MEHRAKLLATIRRQGVGFGAWGVLGSPFYEGLCEELALDVEHDGPAARLLAPFADAPFEAAYVLRLLGGVHRLVLSGEAPTLAGHFPSVGGDGDARAAMAAMRELLAAPPPDVLHALDRPPQTNEVGRSVALTSGLLVIAKEVGMPLRLREIGASGGLNLRPDSYWYEQGGSGWGNDASPVRFVDLWHGGVPPFLPGAEIRDRRGCDRDPIDATTSIGILTLLSYVWPEPPERFRRVRDAIELAAATPVVIDRADALVWLPDQLDEPRPGTALVVYHSVVWQYLEPETRAALRAQLNQAGSTATRDTPLAWLRLEPHPTRYAPAELRLTLWNGHAEPHERLLATTSFHGGVITWLSDAPH
jgi:hypothetical protein